MSVHTNSYSRKAKFQLPVEETLRPSSRQDSSIQALFQEKIQNSQASELPLDSIRNRMEIHSTRSASSTEAAIPYSAPQSTDGTPRVNRTLGKVSYSWIYKEVGNLNILPKEKRKASLESFISSLSTGALNDFVTIAIDHRMNDAIEFLFDSSTVAHLDTIALGKILLDLSTRGDFERLNRMRTFPNWSEIATPGIVTLALHLTSGINNTLFYILVNDPVTKKLSSNDIRFLLSSISQPEMIAKLSELPSWTQLEKVGFQEEDHILSLLSARSHESVKKLQDYPAIWRKFPASDVRNAFVTLVRDNATEMVEFFMKDSVHRKAIFCLKTYREAKGMLTPNSDRRIRSQMKKIQKDLIKKGQLTLPKILGKRDRELSAFANKKTILSPRLKEEKREQRVNLHSPEKKGSSVDASPRFTGQSDSSPIVDQEKSKEAEPIGRERNDSDSFELIEMLTVDSPKQREECKMSRGCEVTSCIIQ